MSNTSIAQNLKTILSLRKYFLIFLVSFIFVLISYYLTLVNVVPLETFVKHNSPIFVQLQILLSIINSILTGLAITMFFAIKQDVSVVKSSNIFSVILSFTTTLFTTGCYVCGSLLLPSLGIAAGLAALPFGGIEIKLATILILFYSIYDLNKKYNGICTIYPNEKVIIIMKENSAITFNLRLFYQYRWLFTVYSVALIIVIIPSFFTSKVSLINNPQKYLCNIDKNEK